MSCERGDSTPVQKCPTGIPAWVLTFADLMSLLLAFFVLLFSFSEMDKAIVGQRYMLERMLIGLLSNGHILLEGVPGLAKTLAVTVMSRASKLFPPNWANPDPMAAGARNPLPEVKRFLRPMP